jgi:NTP pyrophosphatase (non-canonical NTP hydrolase)
MNNIPYHEFVKTLKKTGQATLDEMTPEKMMLLDNVCCIMGEAGELFDGLKPYFFYGKPLTDEQKANIKEELGDLLFYIQAVCNTQGVFLEDIQLANREKLQKRYEGLLFTNQAALDRKDK